MLCSLAQSQVWVVNWMPTGLQWMVSVTIPQSGKRWVCILVLYSLVQPQVDGRLNANRTCINDVCNYTNIWQKSGYTSAPFTWPILSGGCRPRRSICHSICYHTPQELIHFIYKGPTPYIHIRQPPKEKSNVLCIYRSGCGNKGNNGNGSEAEIGNGTETE